MIEDKKYIYCMDLALEGGELGLKFPEEFSEFEHHSPIYLLPARKGDDVKNSEYAFLGLKDGEKAEFTLVFDSETGDLVLKETEKPKFMSFRINYTNLFPDQKSPALPYVGERGDILNGYNEFFVLTPAEEIISLDKLLEEEGILLVGRTPNFPPH